MVTFQNIIRIINYVYDNMAGYSKTPLLQKLGIRSGDMIYTVNHPENYWSLLGELPEGVEVQSNLSSVELNFIHAFFKDVEELESQIINLKQSLSKHGMLWVSWPKKASKVNTTLSDGIVRNIGLHAGLVDTKKCAIDEIWSGLKFVYRLKDR